MLLSVSKANWFLGFVEGEGSFLIRILYAPKRRYLHGVEVKPMFTLSQSDMDTQVITFIGENIFSKLGIDHRIGHNDGKQESRIDVENVTSCKNLIKLLDKLEWHTKKYYDYEKWKECLKLKEEGAIRTKRGILKIVSIRDTMNLHYGKSTKKYDEKFFRELWKKEDLDQEPRCVDCGKPLPHTWGRRCPRCHAKYRKEYFRNWQREHKKVKRNA